MRTLLSFGYSIASMLMLYTGLGLAAGTSSPIVVVLSGSMEPGFQRGDLLFLTNHAPQNYDAGDIVVFKLPSKEVSIVHRVVQSFGVAASDTPSYPYSTHASPPLREDQLMLTKGDNNPVDDLVLYDGLEHIQRKHVVGKVRGIIRYVGYASILMNEDPRAKYALFVVLGVMSLFTNT